MKKIWKFYLILFGVLIIGIFYYYHYGSQRTDLVTITHVERNPKEDYWMILSNNHTYKNVDSFWHLKFNSSDISGRLQSGEKYKITSYGIRVHFPVTIYRNIINVEKI